MEKIRDIRKKLGMTQEKLAELVDLSVNYISEIENGKKKPSLKRLGQIAKALGVPASYLLSEEGDKVSGQIVGCPLIALTKTIESFDGISKEIIQILSKLPAEERIKILAYAKDQEKIFSARLTR